MLWKVLMICFFGFDALFYLRTGFVVNKLVTRVLSSLQKKRQIEIFHKNTVLESFQLRRSA